MAAQIMNAGRRVLLRQVIPAALIFLGAGLVLLLPAPQAALATAQGGSSISAGEGLSCAIESGEAYCWGDNYYGDLGDGSTTNSNVPVAVDTSGVLAGETITQIAAGGASACALGNSGAVYCWGDDIAGELGDGSTTSSSVPVAVDTSGVLAGKTLTQISAGSLHTCALDSAGAAYCWGDNYSGDLGDGSTTSSSVPVAVDTSGVLAGKTLTQISAGSLHTCALDSAGAAYCWGYNGNGGLGDGSNSDSSVPVAVDTSGALAGKTLTQISAGGYHTCTLDSAGAAYCWGLNIYGDLGDGSTTNSNVPVAVDTSGGLAGKTLTQITAGEYHTCALDSAGTAYCWGDDGWGALGNDSYRNSSIAVAVDTSGVLAGKSLVQITADGSAGECALDSTGATYCWGYNYNGQLGDGAPVRATCRCWSGHRHPPG